MARLNQRGPVQTHEIMGQDSKPTLIMFHGYGADCFDLVPLSEVVSQASDWHWIFPQGPFEVPIGPGWTGRAWWPLNIQDITSARDISSENPPVLAEIRKKVMAMIETLKIPWNQIVLGGFSQGGMLALDIAMHAPENPMGLVLLSTALLNKQGLASIAGNHKGLTFYLSHGAQDPVIEIKNSQRLEGFLNSHGIKGKLRIFQGGHEIPAAILAEVGTYLDLFNTDQK